MSVRVEHGDSRVVLPTLGGDVFDSCVCDPPYSLVSIAKRFGKPGSAPAQEGADGRYRRAAAGFMGKAWDTGETAFDPEFWRLVHTALKPGAHLVAFGGTRTYHRLVCAIEDAGFEIRDTVTWLFGAGFPKSHDVSKGIDRANGDRRPVHGSRMAHDMRGGNLMEASQGLDRGMVQYDYTSAASAASAAWEGWGTALKPACELIVLARKPLGEKTVAANVLKWGTGAINIDACRIGNDGGTAGAGAGAGARVFGDGLNGPRGLPVPGLGRWPANLCHDGSDEVIAGFPETASGNFDGNRNTDKFRAVFSPFKGAPGNLTYDANAGSAARFFYSAKADAGDRWGSKHPTVKPIDLMRWLVRLVTRKGGLVLDPFAGSGTTGVACLAESMRCIMIERETEYAADIQERLAHYSGEGKHSLASKGRKIEPTKAGADGTPLFAQVVA